ncbi:hypothetical protein CK203_018340 [Vitis vinifera]|uniref:Uncharacterized protein n=1 Tax=Vitis vinifera TaxID=29760 RepID=A0A438JPG8_VITVI|nr:hypothetical protein CK203_018340 [Vitis vinifera]
MSSTFSPGSCQRGSTWGALCSERPPFLQGAKKKKKTSNKGKEVKLPTPPKEFVRPPITYEKEVTIKEPENPLPPSISSGPRHVVGLNHSGPPCEAVRADASPLMATPMEEMGVESQGLASLRAKPSCTRTGKGETIEVSCSSVWDDHPEGSETEMATETPTALVVIPDEGTPGETHQAVNEGAPDPEEELLSDASSGGDPVDDVACISASPFSYAELEEKLKQIPPGSTTAMPSAKMFEVVETLVSGLRGMVQQHDLFTDLLRTADYMKAFASQRKDSENQLCLRLEEAEASLSTVRGDNEALRADLADVRSREEPMDACLHEAEDEVALLRGEGEFAAEREELEANYQKQVDDMFFFGYRCYMKKHGIKRDVPSIPPGEEKKLLDKPAP